MTPSAEDRDVQRLGRRILARRPHQGVYVVGITGAVSSGKSTMAQRLSAWAAETSALALVDLVSTDGFLFSNESLAARGLTEKKGCPETYDSVALAAALEEIRHGPAWFPGYSHVTYDVDPQLGRRIDRADILFVEGLGLGSTRPSARLDTLVYLDAEEADLECWYVDRFLGLWAAGRNDPGSFYHRFRQLDRSGAGELARAVWSGINLPNIRDHVLPVRDQADIVVKLDAGHRAAAIRETAGTGDRSQSHPGLRTRNQGRVSR